MKDKKIEKEIMAALAIFLVLISVMIFQSSIVSATPNPAKLYCDKMNEEFGLSGRYAYNIVEEEAGQRGVCVLPDGQEVDAWDFFTGKVAAEYSYCAKMGYASETRTGGIFSSEEQVCVIRNFEFLPSTRVPVADMMGLDYKEREVIKVPPDFEGRSPKDSPPKYSYKDFSSWDWRNPPESTKWAKKNYAFFDEINGWLTSIKDQWSCRACWSFGTMGATEAKYKINSDDPVLSPDLSEQYLVSSCCEECGDCSGGSRYASFEYLATRGVSDEQCFRYTGQDSGCIPCSSHASRLWKIDDYTIAKYAGIDDLKQRIIDSGPVTIIMDWGGTFENCIYKCNGKKDEGTHIIVLAGYNDTGIGTGYWIVKNSFGLSWPGICNIGQGYFRLAYDTCNVGAIIYPKNVIAPDIKPTIVLNNPENDFFGKQQMVNFGFTVYTKISDKAECSLIVDDVKRKDVLVNNATTATISDRFEYGKHTWRVECWEDKIEVKASSETRNFELGFQFEDENQTTIVYLSEPYDGYSGSENVTLKCEAYDTRNIRDLSLYVNLSGWTMIITNDFCDKSCFLEYPGTFGLGKYEWNCLAWGSQSAWAKDNFTFSVINESDWVDSNNSNYSDFDDAFNRGYGDGTLANYFTKFEASIGECAFGNRRCVSPKALQQCVDGRWGGLLYCMYGCNPSSLKCRICQEGERKCDENDKNALVCSRDSWKTQLCESGCERGECRSGSQDTGGDYSDIYTIVGIPLIVILLIVAIIVFVKRKKSYLSDDNTKFMQAIKNGI
jgi:putative hemolysin